MQLSSLTLLYIFICPEICKFSISKSLKTGKKCKIKLNIMICRLSRPYDACGFLRATPISVHFLLLWRRTNEDQKDKNSTKSTSGESDKNRIRFAIMADKESRPNKPYLLVTGGGACVLRCTFCNAICLKSSFDLQ